MDVKFRASFLTSTVIVLLAVTTLIAASNEPSPSSDFNVKDFSTVLSHPHNVIPVHWADVVQRIKNLNIAPEQENVVLADNSYSDCGVANTNKSSKSDSEISRIVGGEETAPNEFPWQALIIIEMASSENVFCGGSLIADQWILTAAHCFGQQVKSTSVYLGVHNYAATDEINRKMYLAKNYIVHPDWNANSYSNDIAMIKLSATVTFSQYIRPICVASSTEPDYVNELATVAGWGFTSDGLGASLSSVLRKVTVPVISNSVCSDTYSNLITEKIMCTSGANRSGPCKSDSGGPLNFKQSNGIWKQIGIVSFGSSLGCQKNFPSGYTRISSYSSWIQGIITPTTSTKSVSTISTTTSIPITSPSSFSPETYAFLSLVTLSFAISYIGSDKYLSSFSFFF